MSSKRATHGVQTGYCYETGICLMGGGSTNPIRAGRIVVVRRIEKAKIPNAVHRSGIYRLVIIEE
jgi:hypothetical protein